MEEDINKGKSGIKFVLKQFFGAVRVDPQEGATQ